MSTVVIDNMLKGFQDENTDPAKVNIVIVLINAATAASAFRI